MNLISLGIPVTPDISSTVFSPPPGTGVVRGDAHLKIGATIAVVDGIDRIPPEGVAGVNDRREASLRLQHPTDEQR